MTQQPTTEISAKGNKAAPGLGLSAQDVARLISEDSPAARIEVLQKVAQDHAGPKLSEREQAIAEQVFRILMRDAEVKVRAALADALKENSKTPRDVILHMVEDVEDVSLPVIQYSEVLSEADLISIVRESQKSAPQVAVAKRKRVAPAVSAALIETKKPQVVTELVGNDGAEIKEDSFEAILDIFPENKKILTHLTERHALPPVIAEKLIHRVSGKLADALKKKMKHDADIKAETDRAREIETLKLVEGKASPQQMEQLARQMHDSGRLTPSLVLTSLCRGNLEFFEALVAQLTGVALRNARMLIEDRGELGFKALYEKAKLPKRLFLATRIVLGALLDLRQEMKTTHGKLFANRLVERVISRAQGDGIENLSYILALIRQNNMH